jgi:4-carboxymuconolactone decarboxylase
MVSLYDHNPRSNCTSAEKGLEIQRQILGDCIEQMYAQSPKDQLHIQQYLSANCFGDYLTRKGLDLKTRELLTLSMLAALGGCEPQLAGHVAANLAVGNDRQVLINTITQLHWHGATPKMCHSTKTICPDSTPAARSFR